MRSQHPSGGQGIPELRPSVEYYVSVAAVDAAGKRTYSDLLIVRTPRDTIAASAATGLHVDSVSASQVALSWNAATGVGRRLRERSEIRPRSSWGSRGRSPTAARPGPTRSS